MLGLVAKLSPNAGSVSVTEIFQALLGFPFRLLIFAVVVGIYYDLYSNLRGFQMGGSSRYKIK